MNDAQVDPNDTQADPNEAPVTEQAPVILDGIAAPPLPPLVVPDGHVAVRRIGTPCYLPGDGVTVRTGEVWHIPAEEADEVCYPEHPYGVWELATDTNENSPVAQSGDDPGALSEEEHPANAADTQSESEAKAEEINATQPPEQGVPENLQPGQSPQVRPRRYVMPDTSAVQPVTTTPEAPQPPQEPV